MLVGLVHAQEELIGMEIRVKFEIVRETMVTVHVLEKTNDVNGQDV